MDPALHELLRTGDGDDLVPAIVRLDPREPPPPQLRVVARFGDIATVRVRRGDVPEAYASDGVASLKATRLLMPEPVEPAADATPAVPDAGETMPNLPPGFARRDPEWPIGRGTVVAALDWGLDFSHPEFRRADGRTRIDALWDQGARYDPAHPNPYGYGRVYRWHEIDRALATDTPFATLGYDPRRADRGSGTHGTHVLGIAAGTGRVGPGGIAPGASLVFVELAPATGRPGRRTLTDSAAVLEALHFVDAEAAARPACINMSLGTHGGPHDGSALVEQGIDAFLDASPRRVVVQSTGNYFAKRVHAGGRIAAGERALLPMVVDREDTTPNDLEAWYRGGDVFRAHVQAPDGRIVATAALGEIRPVVDGDVEIGRLYHRARDPNNHDHQVQLRLDAPAAVGQWTLVLEGVTVVDGRYDAWIERDTHCAACQPTFPRDRALASSTTGSICNGQRSIVVGAYDAHDPDLRLGRFSSSGPTRDGRGKPDLVAPGVRVLSARSTPRHARAGGARLASMSGTSMAAPHVSGTVALMLETCAGRLDNARIRELLRATARPDPRLDATDRLRFGAGRLDTAAALAAVRAALASPLLPAPETAMESPTTPSCGCAHRTAAPETEAAVEAAKPDAIHAEPAAENDEAAAERRRYYDRGPIIAPVIGVGGLGAAVVAPLTGGVGIAVPIVGTPATPAPAPVPAGPTPPPLPAAAQAPAMEPFDAPIVVASSDPVVTGERDPFDEGAWLVSERDAADAAHSWIAAQAADAEPATPLPVEAQGETLPAFEHVDEFDEIADAAVGDDPRRSPAAFVAELLARAGSAASGVVFDEHRHDLTALPARMFDHFSGRRRALPEGLARHFEVVALPGGAAPALAAGDLLLRRGEGGFAHVAVLAAPELWPAAALHRNGFRTEHALQGAFVHVIEPGPTAARRDDRRARRLCDATLRLLPDTLVLRALRGRPRALALPYADYDETVDARWIQSTLNRLLGIDLVVDGAIGPQTRAAIRAFQNRHGLVADGVVGPRTEAALRDALAGDTPGGSSGQVRAPSPPGVTAAPDCTVLDAFDQGRENLQPAHFTLLVGVARQILRAGVRVVDVTGFASSEGDDASNLALGLRRAVAVSAALRDTLERIRPGSSAGVAIVPLTRGESEQIAGGDPVRNRRVRVCLRAAPAPVPVPPVVPARTRLFVVTGKSFINVIGSRVGTLNCGIDLGPISIPGASNIALSALAAVTDRQFHENPTNDRISRAPPPDSKGYRLFSQGDVQAQHQGTHLLNVSLADSLRTDAGRECFPVIGSCLQPDPLIIDQPFSTQRIDASRIRFRWAVKGRPHRLAEPLFQAVCRRDSVFIWHVIKGVVDASSGTPVISTLIIEGSRFPSHRAWVDDVERFHVPQNEYAALWDGTPGDPTRVH